MRLRAVPFLIVAYYVDPSLLTTWVSWVAVADLVNQPQIILEVGSDTAPPPPAPRRAPAPIAVFPPEVQAAIELQMRTDPITGEVGPPPPR